MSSGWILRSSWTIQLSTIRSMGFISIAVYITARSVRLRRTCGPEESSNLLKDWRRRRHSACGMKKTTITQVEMGTWRQTQVYFLFRTKHILAKTVVIAKFKEIFFISSQISFLTPVEAKLYYAFYRGNLFTPPLYNVLCVQRRKKRKNWIPWSSVAQKGSLSCQPDHLAFFSTVL